MKSWTRLALLGVVLVLKSASPGNAQSESGQRIYHGVTPSALDETELSFSENGYALPARSFPCVSCHGEFGKGRPERGIVPPDLSRDALTKPYEIRAERGRVRGPYSLADFKRAVRDGIDSSGNILDETMPRYRLSDEALEELWEYLGAVRESSDPGITQSELKLVFVTGGQIDPGKIERLLAARVAQINDGGGVHGRRLDVTVVERLQDESYVRDAFLILSLVPISESQRSGRPVLQLKSDRLSGPADVFSLVAGPQEQAAGLRFFAAREFMTELKAGDGCDAGSSKYVLFVDEVVCLDRIHSDAVLFMTEKAFKSLGPETRRKIRSKTYLALSANAAQLSPRGQMAFSRFASVHKIEMGADVIDLANAYTLATLAIDILMRSGRMLSTSNFVVQVEDVRSYIGGVSPPLTFGPNRRVGNTGSLIVEIDLPSSKAKSSGEWVELPVR